MAPQPVWPAPVLSSVDRTSKGNGVTEPVVRFDSFLGVEVPRCDLPEEDILRILRTKMRGVDSSITHPTWGDFPAEADT